MFSALRGVLRTPWTFIYILEVLVELKKKNLQIISKSNEVLNEYYIFNN